MTVGLAVLGMTFLWATSHTGWFLIVGSLTSLLGLLADPYLRDKESAHRKLSSRQRNKRLKELVPPDTAAKRFAIATIACVGAALVVITNI